MLIDFIYAFTFGCFFVFLNRSSEKFGLDNFSLEEFTVCRPYNLVCNTFLLQKNWQATRRRQIKSKFSYRWFEHPIIWYTSAELSRSNLFLGSITPKTSEMKKTPEKKLIAKVHPKYVKWWGVQINDTRILILFADAFYIFDKGSGTLLVMLYKGCTKFWDTHNWELTLPILKGWTKEPIPHPFKIQIQNSMGFRFGNDFKYFNPLRQVLNYARLSNNKSAIWSSGSDGKNLSTSSMEKTFTCVLHKQSTFLSLLECIPTHHLQGDQKYVLLCKNDLMPTKINLFRLIFYRGRLWIIYGTFDHPGMLIFF